jgi:hypothetical protein
VTGPTDKFVDQENRQAGTEVVLKQITLLIGHVLATALRPVSDIF